VLTLQVFRRSSCRWRDVAPKTPGTIGVAPRSASAVATQRTSCAEGGDYVLQRRRHCGYLRNFFCISLLPTLCRAAAKAFCRNKRKSPSGDLGAERCGESIQLCDIRFIRRFIWNPFLDNTIVLR